MDIPDQIRADIFLEEFTRLDAADTVPNFVLIYLPQDHTIGITEGRPTPRACVADNDFALGRGMTPKLPRSRCKRRTQSGVQRGANGATPDDLGPLNRPSRPAKRSPRGM